MEFILSAFNTRELATGVILLIFIIFIVSRKSVRDSIFSLVKLLSFSKLFFFLLFMCVYIVLELLLFYKMKLWDFSLIKEVLYWDSEHLFFISKKCSA